MSYLSVVAGVELVDGCVEEELLNEVMVDVEEVDFVSGVLPLDESEGSVLWSRVPEVEVVPIEVSIGVLDSLMGIGDSVSVHILVSVCGE